MLPEPMHPVHPPSAEPRGSREKSLERENAALRRSLQQARELIGIAPAFFGFLDPYGNIQDVNDLAVQVVGSTR